MNIKHTLATAGLAGSLLLGACGASSSVATEQAQQPVLPGVGSAPDDRLACQLMYDISGADGADDADLARTLRRVLAMDISEGGNGLRWQVESFATEMKVGDLRAMGFDARRLGRNCAPLVKTGER